MRFFQLLRVFLILYMLSACSEYSSEETLTATHGSEVHTIIENYHLVSGSLEAHRDPILISQVATGPLLETLLSVATPQSDGSFRVTRSVILNEVHVLEYTPSRIRAIGCGIIQLERVTFEGEYLEMLPLLPLQNVYVFVRENDVWKLFTHFGFVDHDSAIRDWEYLSSEEKQAIGDVRNYVDNYFDCATNS